MTVLLSMLGYVAETVHTTRIRCRCIRQKHWMREMSDGPVCLKCGTFWPWRE